MLISHLDHLVLTVVDIDKTSSFYSAALGMTVITFGDNRTALSFGAQKINLHPARATAVPSGGDGFPLCRAAGGDHEYDCLAAAGLVLLADRGFLPPVLAQTRKRA